VRRRLTQWTTAKPLQSFPQSLITFGFDDFPKSAADTGAEIIESINAKAIYYTSTGLESVTLQTGEQFKDTDMLALAKAGHEIGAHTHSHIDCSNASIETIMMDIERNLVELKTMGLDAPVEHFAYPYGETTVRLKKALREKFVTCRGVLAGLNNRSCDAMQLRAMELTPDAMTTDRALYAIEIAMTRPIWLHIFTHDVRQTPSDFGTTPANLMRIARHARDSKIPIVTPSAAMRQSAGAEHV
jgi:peptidoglycan/xylan/chitin deacetylase (PgdA/CDA1 family)